MVKVKSKLKASVKEVPFKQLISLFKLYLQHWVNMDKKMHEVTKKIERAEKDIAKKLPKVATKVLKSAVKKNEKLVKIDKNVRDPIVNKYKKVEKVVKSKGKN